MVQTTTGLTWLDSSYIVLVLTCPTLEPRESNRLGPVVEVLQHRLNKANLHNHLTYA